MMLSPAAEKIFKARYQLNEEETWEGCARRIATAVSKNEENETEWFEKFEWIIKDRLFIPGGRIIRNAGKSQTNLLNCFGLVCEDSIYNIAETLKESIIISAEGGGIGINFDLRPAGAPIKRKGGVSSGVVSFITLFNTINDVICTGGDRRGALLAFIRVDHPDVLEFIDAKSKEGRLSNFNISVAITHEFLDAVENNEEWPLTFGGKTYKIVKARKLWNKILENMVKHAEPGLLNMTNMAINTSHMVGSPIECCNACAELNLERYGACNLSALVLPKFTSGSRTNWKLLEEVVPIAIRFLDNILNVTTFPLPEIQQTTLNLRRLGLGTMGLAEYLFLKETRYGSAESIKEIDKLYAGIRDLAYEASIKLAEEKGSFPKYDMITVPKSKFIKRLPRHLQRGIREIGLRNCTLLSGQPTGTTSLLADATSSGIEPLFSKAYRREDRIGERIYIHPLTKKFIENKEKFPEWFVSSEDITPYEHLEVQTTVQRYLDSSCSKTCNCPKGTTVKDLNDLLLSYIRELKGVTIYVDGAREKQVLYHLTQKEAKEAIKKSTDRLDEQDVQCSSGVCDI